MKNPLLIKAGRDILKFLISQVNEKQIALFVQMYAKDGEKDIEKVIDGMDPDKIDWAITQAQNTIIKNGPKWTEIK
jgi:hypothetical protein